MEFLVLPTELKLKTMIHDNSQNHGGNELAFVGKLANLGNIIFLNLRLSTLCKRHDFFFLLSHLVGSVLPVPHWSYSKLRSENTKHQPLMQLIPCHHGNQSLGGYNTCSLANQCTRVHVNHGVCTAYIVFRFSSGSSRFVQQPSAVVLLRKWAVGRLLQRCWAPSLSKPVEKYM